MFAVRRVLPAGWCVPGWCVRALRVRDCGLLARARLALALQVAQHPRVWQLRVVRHVLH